MNVWIDMQRKMKRPIRAFSTSDTGDQTDLQEKMV